MHVCALINYSAFLDRRAARRALTQILPMSALQYFIHFYSILSFFTMTTTDERDSVVPRMTGFGGWVWAHDSSSTLHCSPPTEFTRCFFYIFLHVFCFNFYSTWYLVLVYPHVWKSYIDPNGQHPDSRFDLDLRWSKVKSITCDHPDPLSEPRAAASIRLSAPESIYQTFNLPCHLSESILNWLNGGWSKLGVTKMG